MNQTVEKEWESFTESWVSYDAILYVCRDLIDLMIKKDVEQLDGAHGRIVTMESVLTDMINTEIELKFIKEEE